MIGGWRDALERPSFLARSALGGALMGLANLVPGISGGTMLLATGVYTGFIGAIAELTTLRLRARSLLLLGSVGGTAALVILLLAGPTKTLVVEERWAMYSLFIGLTLGGVPIVWELTRSLSFAVGAGAVGGFAVMLLMLLVSPPEGAGANAHTGLLFVAGLAGASAMILPGVSGGYLLLLLGQYVPILAALDAFKQGLLGAAEGTPDWVVLAQPLHVLVPVGVGVAAGVVGVSNLIEWLLRRFREPTLGVLLGLLLGAVVGLWPFQQGVPPAAPSQAAAENLDPEHWPVERFTPSPLQVAGSLALLACGFVLTRAIGHLGASDPDDPAADLGDPPESTPELPKA